MKKELQKQLQECLKNIQQISKDAKNKKYASSIRISVNSIEYWQKRAIKILDKIDFMEE